ncbi:MAG TPA: DUF3850 domain-containing protein [Thermoplasmata archaeon]|nr:DUF3850 domain-containing protein [Thermoplasmata archaeon]
MIEHRLKCWPGHFEPLLVGAKRWEIRKNDRGFNVGDVLILSEFQRDGIDESGHTTGFFTGRSVRRKVTWVWDVGDLFPGFVVLDIEREA